MCAFKNGDGSSYRAPLACGYVSDPKADMAFVKTLKKPPTVTQVDDMGCWAAALESWLAVTPDREDRLDQYAILAWYGGKVNVMTGKDPTGVLAKDGGIDLITGFNEIAKEYWMQNERLYDLTIEWLFHKLSCGGHLYLGYMKEKYAHVIVVYGIGYKVRDNGQKYYVVQYMDPADGKYHQEPLSFFQFGSGRGRVAVSVGWPC